MLSLFRTNQLYASFWLLLYVIVLHLSAFLLPTDWQPSGSSLFAQATYHALGASSTVANILAVVLVFFQSLLVHLMCANYKMTSESNFFGGVFYAFVASCFPDFIHLSPILMANTFVVLALYSLFESYKNQAAADHIFNVGLWIGFASLFYFSTIIFLLGALVGLSVVRTFKWRERVILLCGFAAAYLLTFTFYFWNDGVAVFWNEQFADSLRWLNFVGELDAMDFFKLLFFAFLVLLSVFSVNAYAFKRSGQAQKYQQILYIFMLFAATTVLFQQNITLSHLLILSVPLGFFLAFTFSAMRPQIADALYILLVAGAILLQYIHLI